MTGVEGYVESAASGLIAGLNAGRMAKGQDCVVLPAETTLGSMAQYITTADFKHFQPMNANFGLLPALPERIRNKKEKYEKLANRALESIQNFVATVAE
ncbi:Methylenetetrahydrofolate--tRNA-(uracil-5-)-methyltransferase TrmFO [compost metagenome]